MADDAGISEELKTRLQESIDGLFDRIIKSYTSTLEPPESEKWNLIETDRKRDAYKTELVAKLKTAYKEKIDKDTGKQFENILSRTLSDRKNIEQVIDSVCNFVKNIKIKLTGNTKNKTDGLGLGKDRIDITLTFSLTPIGSKIDNQVLYRPAQSLFDQLFATFIGLYFFNSSPPYLDIYYTIRLERGHLSEDVAAQGGSKSRRIRRRKHARKTHHKRASKSHKRRRHSRVARKHKKHTRR